MSAMEETEMPATGSADDATLFAALQNAAKSGLVRVHVAYRKARRVPGFRDAMIAEVGIWPVRIREWFLYVALIGMAVWTLINNELELKSMTTSIFGLEVDYGFLTFMVLLIAVVLVGRKYVKPVSGPLMVHVAMTDGDRFDAAWREGAITLMVHGKGPGRIAISPKHDWRDLVHRHFVNDDQHRDEDDEEEAGNVQP